MRITQQPIAQFLAVSLLAITAHAANTEDTPTNDRERILREFDGDGDGRLSCEERETVRESRREQWRHEAIGQFDADGDGRLTGQERSAAQEARLARRAERIALRDGKRRERRMKRCEHDDEHGDGRHPEEATEGDLAQGGA